MIELEHSPLGGSSAHRFMTCVASFLLHREQLETGQFENIPSEFAELGTGAHELGALCLTEGVEPFEFISEDFNGYKAGWPDGISLDAVHIYFNECMKILDAAKGTGQTLVEQTIHLPEIHPLLKGTVDFGWWHPTVGVKLRDYKNGEGVGVAAVNNQQLKYYAFLMIMAEPWLRAGPRDLLVSLGIVQPNFYGIYEEPDIWETTLGDILDWGHNELLPRMNELMTRRSAVTEDDHVPGEHCQFCPVLLSCVKMQRAFEAYANGSEDFITMLTNEELDHYYAQREYARRFMKALEQTVKVRKLTGANIPSAKLVEPMTARVWKPGGAAAIQAALGEKAFKPREVLSPAGVEKLSSRGKELALEWGYKPEAGGLTVAPITDRRPEAKPRGNATVFERHAQSPEDAGF